MVKQLTKKTDQPVEKWFICFENTGTYSKALAEWLASQQIGFKEVNALLISKSLVYEGVRTIALTHGIFVGMLLKKEIP
jgi:hypothetical protein